ncbi:MAG: hypothetical protein ACI9UK_000673 [Candidatus Krumholzibacteriia bacterium]|jgi:hypothetical protein
MKSTPLAAIAKAMADLAKEGNIVMREDHLIDRLIEKLGWDQTYEMRHIVSLLVFSPAINLALKKFGLTFEYTAPGEHPSKLRNAGK